LYWLYVLKSAKDSRLYTGVTCNLQRRIREHNSGKVRSTRTRQPLFLAHHELFQTKSQALARERFFKTPAGGALKQQLVAYHQETPAC